MRVGGEADLVLARVGGGEGEAARVAAAVGHDAVVIVEGLLDGDEHGHGGIEDVRVGLLTVDLSFVVSYRTVSV